MNNTIKDVYVLHNLVKTTYNGKECGIFAQSKNCGARETTVAR
jgi:hypothetical protein